MTRGILRGPSFEGPRFLWREETLAKHVALIGLPGAGKSCLAFHLAGRSGLPGYQDLDEVIERRVGRPLAEIFAVEGEARFRELEAQALEAALARSEPLLVICGGGVLERPGNRELLRASACVVWLQVSPDEAVRRLGPEGVAKRPLLSGPSPEAALRALLSGREAQYAAAADIVVATDGLTPAKVAARIRSELER